ncbi:MAG: DNA-directed RNA polymerase subunit M [Lachnospiraceae bacterium]|nr:DNA-directed RNA polymerase subunit M [Lachnospiraceae bacterium]
MMKLYLCPDCNRLVLASRRASVDCSRCGRKHLPLTKLSFLEYSEMSEEKRQEYARLQAKKIKESQKKAEEK